MDKQNTQYTVKNVYVFVPVFLYAVTMLIFHIKKLFEVKNGLTTSLLKMPTIWVGRTTLNGEKKRMACLLITTALPGKFNVFVHQLSSTPIKNALLG